MKTGKVLVTGGAGYIGSHIVRELNDARRDLRIVDDLSQGHRAAVGDTPLTVAGFADAEFLDGGLDGVDYLVHMAAFCEVGESMNAPAKYYANNLTASLALLEAARRAGVRGIVFSSTAAVYGEPESTPIDEDHPQRPTNPYGETKLAFERALRWYHEAHGLRSVALRYFNAAGAHPDGSIGEDHAPETHLIPRLLRATEQGAEPMSIFGNDYETRDGTCVRDYVHVCDLARAHVRALDALAEERVGAEAFNLGNGEGFSVLEVVDHVERVTGRRPATTSAPRRAGDPATLVASSERIARQLGWSAGHPELGEIIETAWRWYRAHPSGYS
ncbi:MAG: UDP-glucose 4-epimerase GalE [bacterium]|nr:UDP-glucose 4-epimerase GalE [bacterium]